MTSSAPDPDGAPGAGRRPVPVPGTWRGGSVGVSRAARAYLDAWPGGDVDVRFPDLVFGLIHPPGTSAAAVAGELAGRLAVVPYGVRTIALDDPGDGARSGGRGGDDPADLRVLRAIERLVSLREEPPGGGSPRAWVLDGLTHPAEVETLRHVYGRRFFAVACRDGAEAETTAGELGADVFVRRDDAGGTARVVGRLVDCVLSHPFRTPTLDETGMAVAFGVSMASASLSRRVGAVLMADEQIIGIGCNEVPKAGGGVYHAESSPDGREFVLGGDPSDQTRAEILADTLRRLGEVFAIRLRTGEGAAEDVDAPAEVLLREALRSALVREGKLFDIVEYGRAAHAEIVAITSAARRGVPVQDATLYTTTMPCHECMRAIVAAGVRRVVYAEPYAKSRGPALQADSVALLPDRDERTRKVRLEPFCGIGHRRFGDLFSWLPRKHDDQSATRPDPLDTPMRGAAARWDPRTAGVRPSLRDGADGVEATLVQHLREAAAVRRLEAAAPPAPGPVVPLR